MKTSLLTILLTVSVTSYSACGTKGQVFDEQIVKLNDSATLKITAYHENCLFLCGGIYEYRVRKKDAWFSRTIFRRVHDDPNPIPRKNVVVKSKKLAYFWFYDDLRVTLDGGNRWHSWNPSLNNQLNARFYLITKVAINKSGFGVLRIRAYDKKEKAKMVTDNFGKTWRKVK